MSTKDRQCENVRTHREHNYGLDSETFTEDEDYHRTYAIVEGDQYACDGVLPARCANKNVHEEHPWSEPYVGRRWCNSAPCDPAVHKLTRVLSVDRRHDEMYSWWMKQQVETVLADPDIAEDHAAWLAEFTQSLDRPIQYTELIAVIAYKSGFDHALASVDPHALDDLDNDGYPADLHDWLDTNRGKLQL